MRRPTSQRRRARGFTLIELMLTVTIIGILTGLSMGFSGTFRRRANHREVAREIYNGANRARAEALRRSRRARIDFDAARFTAYFDFNTNDVFDAGTDEILYQYPIDTSGPLAHQAGLLTAGALPAGMDITMPVINGENGSDTLFFDDRGFFVTTAGLPLAGTVIITDSELPAVLNVDITVAGALRIR